MTWNTCSGENGKDQDGIPCHCRVGYQQKGPNEPFQELNRGQVSKNRVGFHWRIKVLIAARWTCNKLTVSREVLRDLLIMVITDSVVSR